MAIAFEIKETYVSIPCEKDMNLELNLIRWNNGKPKFDLRKWDAEHSTMSKGLTLTKEEVVDFLSESPAILDKICGTTAKVNHKTEDISSDTELPFTL